MTSTRRFWIETACMFGLVMQVFAWSRVAALESHVSAVAGVLVALIGAWVEAARQSLRERVARIEGRVEALEKSR